ncbi:Vps51/Vps67-domain-containing protein, partial [Rhodotorula diobovata]
RKRRTRLRDYYALATPREGHHQLDLDSPDSFDPHSYFTTLSSTASLPDLLKREIELLNGTSPSSSEIRELDGERQSLVYNHHHELIDASDTIRKMKSRAEALDTSLDALKTSFESVSQLSAATTRAAEPPSAAPPPRPAFNPLTHLSALLSLPILLRALLLHGQAQGQGGDHAPSQAQAHALWGAWEPALRSWEDGGVEGAREVGSECREVLR